jgi:uncharacterized membrane protein
MRKFLETISVAALATLLYLTWTALYGPNHLAGQIPTHFGAMGQPTSYGPASTLWLLPIVGLGLYALITVVGLFPGAFNYPVRVTVQNRDRLQRIAVRMVVGVKAEILILFAILQYEIIQSVRTQTNSLPILLMPMALALIFLTLALHIAALLRAA